MQQRIPRFNSATGGFAYSLNLIFFLFSSFVVSLIITLCHFEKGSDGYIYLSYLGSPIAIAATLAVTVNLFSLRPALVFPAKCRPKYYLVAVPLIFGLLFSFNQLNGATTDLFCKLFPKYVPNANFLPSLDGAKILPALLIIAVIPALAEEALFRGVILNCCVRGAGTVRTVFIVGFCFSLFHAAPEQTVYQFICGCAFALITLRAGSALPAVIMHFINNALIVILSAAGCIGADQQLIISTGGNIAITVVAAVCFVAASVFLALDRGGEVKAEKGGVARFFIYASVGIAVLALIWILRLFGVN